MTERVTAKNPGFLLHRLSFYSLVISKGNPTDYEAKLKASLCSSVILRRHPNKNKDSNRMLD